MGETVLAGGWEQKVVGHSWFRAIERITLYSMDVYVALSICPSTLRVAHGK